LLGALPITPFETISAKIKVLRRDLMLMVAPCLLIVGYAWRDPHALPMIAWRLLAFGTAVLIYSQGAVAVAFLTLGLGGTRPRAGAYGSLDSLLLVFPCIGVVFADSPWGAVLSLMSLAALSFEARRAATKVVDWLDDPAAEHGTELWRTLVVFAAFQASQLLLGQLLQLFGPLLSDMQRLAIVYLLTGTGLWFICELQQMSPPLASGARRAAWGLLAGGAAAGFAWIYLTVLAHFTPPELHHTWASPLEQVLLSLAMVFVAPMAEERFFRGWLLTEIKQALGARPYLAILITAFAFAVVHPPLSFAPVLVLGLLTGALAHFKRSLFACVVAHAIYNALMLLQ
ncbi:MAG TPA: CPBP family intramembrane glutamic endopeptidase, partial [Polyangiaceae bacterium]|nr:CPBP family intramembrane glutamic endopeptidase [Polyangiaceae bacterium]